MKTAWVAGGLSIVSITAAGILVACSSSSGGGGATGADASTDSGKGGVEAGTEAAPKPDAGGGTEAGGSDGGGPESSTPVSCDTYCQLILQNCGAADGGVGGNAQYYDTADCKNTCTLLPVGTYGDTTNSVGCRQSHASLAAQDPNANCAAAGAGGGGVCGSRCDAYCTLVMAHCTVANGADPPYGSQNDCLAACTAYPYQADASDYDPNNIGSLNCLDYHLRESLSDMAGQGIDGGHCDDLSIDGGTVRGACHP
jgi:hypothetical protein